MGFAAFCVAVLIYLLRTPGPPTWLAVALAWSVSGAPFYWGEMNKSAYSAKNIDYIAANIGVPVSGILVALGVPTRISILPIFALFLISALLSIVWWIKSAFPRIRVEALMGR